MLIPTVKLRRQDGVVVTFNKHELQKRLDEGYSPLSVLPPAPSVPPAEQPVEGGEAVEAEPVKVKQTRKNKKVTL